MGTAVFDGGAQDPSIHHRGLFLALAFGAAYLAAVQGKRGSFGNSLGATTAGPVEFTAAALQTRGVVVQCVILERGPVDVAVQLASEAFPAQDTSVGQRRRWRLWATVGRPLP